MAWSSRTITVAVLMSTNLVCCTVDIYQMNAETVGEYKLPDLPYGYNELEPYMDEATVKVHHLGHHMAYTKKLNAALEAWRANKESWLAEESIQTILQTTDMIPHQYKTAVINNGGGYVNHNLYWWVMSPNPDGKERVPSGELLKDIKKNFGTYQQFKDSFTMKATTLFGSGYVWLSRQPKNGVLVISTTANQDSPLSEGLHPLLVIDIWEHAYYLKHKNLRPNYIADWWKLVDWTKVEELDNWFSNKGHDEL